MTTKIVSPTLGAESFNCPSCGALAHQYWFGTFVQRYEKPHSPWLPDPEAAERARNDRNISDEQTRTAIAKYFEQRLKKLPFLDEREKGVWLDLCLENVNVSKCFSCEALAIWVYDQPLFPHAAFHAEPNSDLDDEIRLDFREAAKILDLSPRGAAALLRLCVQKLCVQLGEPGKNIDTDIASLVGKGLEPTIQKALDIVRVIGNEAVHPGQIDLRDDRETATKLFSLVNIVADAMISRPKQIAELYGKLPQAKLAAIEKRDGKAKGD